MMPTKNQVDLMKHTMSDGGRNWFGTSYNCPDSDEFEILIKEGFASSQKAKSWMGDDVIYSLTEKGKEYLNNLPVPKVKKLSKSKARYRRYLEWGDGFDSFLDFCYWDQNQIKKYKTV